MRQDVITAAQMQIFAEIALGVFVVVFVTIIIRAFLLSKESAGEMARIPLEDGTVVTPKESSHE